MLTLVLWSIAIYLLIGTVFYFIVTVIIDEEQPTQMKFNETANIMLLFLVILWLPMLIFCIFSNEKF